MLSLADAVGHILTVWMTRYLIWFSSLKDLEELAGFAFSSDSLAAPKARFSDGV